MKQACSGGRVEARDGIEPPNKGFADLSVTVCVPRHSGENVTRNRRVEPNVSKCFSFAPTVRAKSMARIEIGTNENIDFLQHILTAWLSTRTDT
jgi:hypothetical protein